MVRLDAIGIHLLLPLALTKQTDRVSGGVQAQMGSMQQEYDILSCVLCTCLHPTQLDLHQRIYSVSLLCRTLALYVFLCLFSCRCSIYIYVLETMETFDDSEIRR